MKRSLLISSLLLFFLAGTSLAASLRNYENRVKRADEQIERIKVDPEYSDEGIETIKWLLPKTEKIDQDGHPANVDNNWLYDLLDSYELEEDDQQRLAYLTEIGDRLTALDEQLVRAAESLGLPEWVAS